MEWKKAEWKRGSDGNLHYDPLDGTGARIVVVAIIIMQVLFIVGLISGVIR